MVTLAIVASSLPNVSAPFPLSGRTFPTLAFPSSLLITTDEKSSSSALIVFNVEVIVTSSSASHEPLVTVHCITTSAPNGISTVVLYAVASAIATSVAVNAAPSASIPETNVHSPVAGAVGWLPPIVNEVSFTNSWSAPASAVTSSEIVTSTSRRSLSQPVAPSTNATYT